MSATTIDLHPSAIGRRNVLRLALVGGVVATTGFSAAARADDAATAQIQRLGAALVSLKQNGGAPFAEHFAQFAPVADETFDLQQILRFSVGPDWSTISADQQQHLLQVFRQYTVASFVSNFDKPGDAQFRITGERQAAGQTIVDTMIGDTKLSFVMRQTAAGWRVVDVLADGTISRVATQRSDFRSALMRGGGPALIASLQRKVSDLSGGSIA